MLDGYLLSVVAVTAVLVGRTAAHTAPHIIVILADDLGWNDVGFHGSDQIPTPNIDALAYNGVILNNHYTPALCTPSRSAFMTGKYPIHTGMQHLVILEAEPWGLPLQERLLPEYLRTEGYRTHAVGKWHLGFFKKEYTPLYRGFDSHFGYYQGFQDYFNHSVKATYQPYDGYDMRRNLEVDWASRGRYSTDVFTEEAVRVISDHDPSHPLFLYLSHLAPHAGTTRDPFQAPDQDIARFSHIEDPERRVYAAMVWRLDQSVGEVVSALRSRGMLDNSVVVFMADNGAPTHGIHSNRGSNYPLRGIKETPWEGGVRTAAAIWSPLIKRRQRVSSQMMHMTDWLPTIYSATGGNVSDLGDIDGVDMWEALVTDSPSPRTQFVYNIDDKGDVYAALRKGDWKYIKGNVHKGIGDGWYGEVGRAEATSYDVHGVLRSAVGASIAGLTTRMQIKQKRLSRNATDQGQWSLLDRQTALALRRDAQLNCSGPRQECIPRAGPCIFNIRDDPCELNNLASQRLDVLVDLEDLLARYRETMVLPNNKPSDPMADPALWNDTWVWWQDPPPPAERHMLHDIIAAAIILVALVALVAVVLRLFSPFSFLPKSPEAHGQDLQAEKATLTFDGVR